jgi:hypothetical protein
MQQDRMWLLLVKDFSLLGLCAARQQVLASGLVDDWKPCRRVGTWCAFDTRHSASLMAGCCAVCYCKLCPVQHGAAACTAFWLLCCLMMQAAELQPAKRIGWLAPSAIGWLVSARCYSVILPLNLSESAVCCCVSGYWVLAVVIFKQGQGCAVTLQSEYVN